MIKINLQLILSSSFLLTTNAAYEGENLFVKTLIEGSATVSHPEGQEQAVFFTKDLVNVTRNRGFSDRSFFTAYEVVDKETVDKILMEAYSVLKLKTMSLGFLPSLFAEDPSKFKYRKYSVESSLTDESFSLEDQEEGQLMTELGMNRLLDVKIIEATEQTEASPVAKEPEVSNPEEEDINPFHYGLFSVRLGQVN